jgi:predicted dehydrogenase
MMEPVGIGLVGCGSNGQIHADGLAKLVADGEISAVIAADPSVEAREAANRNCSFGHLSAVPEDVVAHPDVEAVLVCGPTSTHATTVLACAEAGKAVMCEKPLAPSFSEVSVMADAVAGAGIVGQVGFHSRFNPLFSWLQETVASRRLGDVLGYMLREDQFWPTGSVVPGHSSWRSDPAVAGGGALLEHTIHGCDLLLWMFGPVSSVSARSRSVFGFGVEDVVTAHVAHLSGPIGTVTTVFNGVEGREERRLEVFFEQGTIEVTGDFIVGAEEETAVVHRPGAEDEVIDLAALREETFAAAGVERRDFLFYQYLADRSFVRAIRGGPPAGSTFEDARAAHALVEAAYRSAARAATPVEPGGLD